jgi:hypothetical protein
MNGILEKLPGTAAGNCLNLIRRLGREKLSDLPTNTHRFVRLPSAPFGKEF